MKYLILSVSLFLIAAARADTITFADLSQPGQSVVFVDSPYTQNGFNISDSSTQFLMWQTGSENYFGKTALLPGFYDSLTSVTRTDGSLFDMLSIDLATVGLDFTDSQSLLFTGTFLDQSTITVACAISSTPVFSTCDFGHRFTNVSSVTWGTEALFQYTDVVVNAAPVNQALVPEPFTLGTTAVALALLIFFKCCRRVRAARRSWLDPA